MKLLDEIRRQPLPIRHLFMWTMVVIVFSVFGIAYFRSTQQRFIAMINPQPSVQPQEDKNSTSPFALIGDTFSNLGANISGLIFGDTADGTQAPLTTFAPIPPQRLP